MIQPGDSRSRSAGCRIRSVPLGFLCAFIVFFSAHAAEIDYQFNSRGQLVTATYSDGTVVTYNYDENGNRMAVSSAGGPDRKAPTMPASVTATVVSSTRIDVSWSASSDGGASGLAGYKIYAFRTGIDLIRPSNGPLKIGFGARSTAPQP